MRMRSMEQDASVAVWIKAQPLGDGRCPEVLLKAWRLPKSARSKGQAVVFMVHMRVG